MPLQMKDRSPIRNLLRQAPEPLRQAVKVGMTKAAQTIGQIRGRMERGGPPSQSVCVMGLHRSVLGLGRGARLFQTALGDIGIKATAWDVSAFLGDDSTLPAPVQDFSDVSTVVTHLNPIEHVHLLAVLKGPRPKRGFRVGYWAWETSQLPQE